MRRYEFIYTMDLIPNRECRSIIYESSEKKAKKKFIEKMQADGTAVNIIHISWMYCECGCNESWPFFLTTLSQKGSTKKCQIKNNWFNPCTTTIKSIAIIVTQNVHRQVWNMATHCLNHSTNSYGISGITYAWIAQKIYAID